MVLIDNGISAIASIGLEGDIQTSNMNNIIFHGESEAKDCKVKGHCAFKNKTDSKGCHTKAALFPSSFANHNKPPVIDAPSLWPQYKIKADASFGGTTFFNNLQFIGFDSNETYCGMQNRIIMLNEYNADYYPPVYVTNARFEVR
jgi:hypothetical protein